MFGFGVAQQIREVLAEMLEAEPEKNSRPVAKILRLLERLEQHDLHRLNEVLDTTKGARQYRVEPSTNGGALVEVRVGTTGQPFRCPYHIYHEAAKAIPGLPRVFSFNVLHNAVNKSAGKTVPAHQLRPCLRLWSDRQLLSTLNRDYRKASASLDFTAEAEKLWQELRGPQHE